MDSGKTSFFKNLEELPWDPIVEISAQFKACTVKDKVNLTIGVYRTEEDKPLVFSAVRKAEEQVLSKEKHLNYLDPLGCPEFRAASQNTIFNESIMASGRVITAQSISGTGSLRLGAEFLSKHLSKELLVSDPTWGNHIPLFKNAGFNVGTYRYYDPKTKFFNFEGMLADLEKTAEGTVICLISAGHNPTGIDPTKDQWVEIAKVMKRRKLFPFFDNAYQGFVTGDMLEDAFQIHHFLDEGFEMAIGQSFSKNLGLYGERAGALHLVLNNTDNKENIEEELRNIATGLYLAPVNHGARLATIVLSNPELKKEWLDELQTVVQRIDLMRVSLHEALISNNCPGNWDHLKNQKGMFSYTGLTKKQSQTLIDKHAVYLLKSGRISLSGLNKNNIKKVADAIKDVVETVKE